MKNFLQRYQIRLAIGLWALLLGIVGANVLSGNKHTVTGAYAEASEAWMGGGHMYSGGSMGFLYMPQAAILYIPFYLLPGHWGDVAWRFISVCAFLFAVFRWESLGRECVYPDGKPGQLFPLFTLVSVPLAFSAVRNGQATILMMSLMILAAMEIRREKWWSASWMLGLCLAIKPLALVMILLAGTLFPTLALRFAVVLAFVFLAPFLFQEHGYVQSQYIGYLEQLKTTSRLAGEGYLANVFSISKVFGVRIPDGFQRIMQLVFAAGTLGACWFAKRRVPSAWLSILLYSFSTCYLMLFNPRTENNTYAMMGPVLGMFIAYEAFKRVRKPYVIALGFGALCTVGSYEFGKLVTPPEKSVWLAPLVCALFSVYLVFQVSGDKLLLDNPKRTSQE